MDHPLRVTLPSGGYDIVAPDGDVLDKLASVRHFTNATSGTGNAELVCLSLLLRELFIMIVFFRCCFLRRILQMRQLPASRDGEASWLFRMSTCGFGTGSV